VELVKLEDQRLVHGNGVRDARILVDDLTKEQKKADADVEQVKARRERDRTRMDAGLITNPKDLERMSHELESLERRINSLEDDELEVMERLEEAQTELANATRALAAIEEKRTDLEAARLEKSAAIEKELAEVTTDRAAAIVGLPEDLLGLYERIRSQSGIGAAELRARQCGGCMLTLNPSDLAVIAKTSADEVVRCEECARILVRTSESGI
jgi:predicted  nucleic acid-binding Zn-ribbon protein